MNNFKTDFQKIHYNKKKANFFLRGLLIFFEMFYGLIINIKNFLYEKNILKEEKVKAKVICVGNLTTGGVGKTPIVIELANKYAKENSVAIISRGYGAKISNKNPNIIKDYQEIKYKNGLLCGDEPYQIAKKVNKNVIVITCANRKLSAKLAIEKFNSEVIIMDDGFSNRKLNKDETILVIDSKMRFGNNHLLPYGPLREPISEIKRAGKIVLVNKGDENLDDALNWVKKFNKPFSLCQMKPKRIYNIQTGADVKLNCLKVLAFCAIGQPQQFFDFVKKYYDIIPVAFQDHHKYTKNDIEKLIKIAKENNVATFITTQKDETKISSLIKNFNGFSFNVLELEVSLEQIS